MRLMSVCRSPVRFIHPLHMCRVKSYSIGFLKVVKTSVVGILFPPTLLSATPFLQHSYAL